MLSNIKQLQKMSIYLSIYLSIYSVRKSNNYSLKSAQQKSVIILREEDNAKQLYFFTSY